MLITTLGGLGLFLLGMIIMTGGIREIAGKTLRAFLLRFTRTPLTGALTGTCTTAVLQSSSATTVASVGFVAAGILTFPQALGIIFGANLGTTVTGWMVALLGFKLKLGEIVLPLILLGAVMRLFGKGKVASSGYAIAGFGLIFVGISFMQSGMVELRDVVSFEKFPADSIGGRIQLLLMGLVFTIITQSSSAGVATTMTALHASLINFEQATSLIIGMDLGTTFTAVMATIGANLEARRTGFSHVVYNIFTAIGAFILITPYIYICNLVAPGGLQGNPEIGLVLFHSTFNVIGVCAIVPFAHPFAALIIRLFPDKRAGVSRYIDKELLKDPASALQTIQKYIPQHIRTLYQKTALVLASPGGIPDETLDELQEETEQIVDFVEELHLDTKQHNEWMQLVNCIHILDHIDRMLDRLSQLNRTHDLLSKDPGLQMIHSEYRSLLQQMTELMQKNAWGKAETISRETTENLDRELKSLRLKFIAKISAGKSEIPEATVALDHMRYMKRMGHHITKIQHYYNLMIHPEEEQQ